jgi:hypothetical protein
MLLVTFVMVELRVAHPMLPMPRPRSATTIRTPTSAVFTTR